MTDRLQTFVLGRVQTNCYIYSSDNEALVVDPAANGSFLADQVKDYNKVVVVATHGHGDHVGGAYDLCQAIGAPWLINACDADEAMRAGDSGPFGFGYDHDAPKPDGYLAEGDVIEVGSASFKVMEAPGHTPGGILLIGEGSAKGIAFSGDTIFKGSVGRCDLAGGNAKILVKSLHRIVEVVDPKTQLFPGHGEATSLYKEILTNPYLQ